MLQNKNTSVQEIDKDLFLSLLSEQGSFCQIVCEKHYVGLRDMFRTVFGLKKNCVSSIVTLSPTQKNDLLDFISTEAGNYDKFIFEIGKLSCSFDAVLSIVKEKHNGWSNDEVRDIFIDSVNLHHLFSEDILPTSFPIYAVNVYGIIPLYKYAECSPYSEINLTLEDENFEHKFKSCIVKNPMRSVLSNILKKSRENKTTTLNQFYANLHVNDTHYVSLFIDVKERTVYTCDSFKCNEEGGNEVVTLMRKWIAKSISIIDYYMDGSEDMCSGNMFGEEEEKQLKEENQLSDDIEYMYHHKEISSLVDYPTQQDDYNCGVYSLWYLLMRCYKDKEIVKLDPDRFRDQLLLYIIFLYIYRHRATDKSYSFKKKFEWQSFFKKKSRKSTSTTQ